MITKIIRKTALIILYVVPNLYKHSFRRFESTDANFPQTNLHNNYTGATNFITMKYNVFFM